MTVIRDKTPEGVAEFDLSQFDALVKVIPYSAGFNMRRAMGRIGNDLRKDLAKNQKSPGMRRFVRKGAYQLPTPFSGKYRAVASFVQNRGLEGIQTLVFFTSDAAVLFEEGGDITKGGFGLPIRHKRAARGLKFRDRPGQRTLAAIEAKSPEPLVWIKSKESGLWTVYERQGRNRRAKQRAGKPRPRRRRRRPEKLLPVVTFHPEVSFEGQLGFESTVAALAPTIDEHLRVALESTVRTMQRLQDRGVIR